MVIFEAISGWLRATLLPYGGLGLMLLAICDSSFLSLPEVNDLLLMTFSIQEPGGMLRFAALTTAGSVIGCALLFGVGRRVGRRRPVGSSFIARQFPPERVERFERWYRKYGVLAVIVPSILPPPTPFKIFVFSAGAFGISWPRFLAAVSLGRGIRYFSEGLLAVTYGPWAIQFVEENFPGIGLALAILIVAAAAAVGFARYRMNRLARIETQKI